MKKILQTPGATIKRKGQHYYIDPKTGEKKLSAINFIKEEEDWDHYNNAKMAAQFLSKQPIDTIRKQINISIADKESHYEDILGIDNKTVRRKMLEDFAETCDKTAVTLETAPLPGQKWHVILPVPSLKDGECYAPNYKNGQKLALVRYPHGGLFEIPICVVNNDNKEGKDILGHTNAAIGVNKHTAEILSGADFDGDTVIAIPTGGKVRVMNKEALPGLVNFDHKVEYAPTETSRRMKKSEIQSEMGKITNLITDMTVKGATDDEIERAVKHSMVIIDAYKSELDYKRSEKDNGILELKNKWQGHYNQNGNWSTGAGSLISRASAKAVVDKRVGSPRINIKGKVNKEGKDIFDPTRPEGAKIFKTAIDNRESGKEGAEYLYYKDRKKILDPDTGEPLRDESGRYLYQDTGKWKKRTQDSTQMAETDDARTLSSGTAKEELYASYANKMKAMANDARKEAATTGNLVRNPSAAKEYEKEVASLKSKVNDAYKNKTRERHAQAVAFSRYHAQEKDNPDMTGKEKRKLHDKAIREAREEAGAFGKKYRFDITDREWEAIQAGAVSDSFLSTVLNNADQDRVKELAMPKRSGNELSPIQINKIKALGAVWTQAEIADAMGLSVSTVAKYMHS